MELLCKSDGWLELKSISKVSARQVKWSKQERKCKKYMLDRKRLSSWYLNCSDHKIMDKGTKKVWTLTLQCVFSYKTEEQLGMYFVWRVLHTVYTASRAKWMLFSGCNQHGKI